CTLCRWELSCCHQGEKDVTHHLESAAHQANSRVISQQQRIAFVSVLDPLTDQVTRAEVKVTALLAVHNFPLVTTDHLGLLLKDICPNSKIAKHYASAKTKSTCMLNGAIAPYVQWCLVSQMKNEPFSLSVEESNDTGLEKMNPLTVRIFDLQKHIVTTQLLDLCLTTGSHATTTEGMFSKIDEKMTLHEIPWQNCVGSSVDNTSVNLGKNNSIKTWVQGKNKSVYFMGCPCHIMHNTASTGVSGFDVEDFCIDCYYYFGKSTKLKSSLEDFCMFCDVEYRQIMKHVHTRWLSLEVAINRLLQQYTALKSYFLSVNDSCVRFERLSSAFSDPMTEVYLMFFQATLPVFTTSNKFLQREDPCTYMVDGVLSAFVQKLLGKFIQVQIIKNAVSLQDVDFANPDNQLPDESLFVGLVIKQTMCRLTNEGDISPATKKFFFLHSVTKYAFKKLPLNDAVLKNATFVNFDVKENCTFEQVEYFVDRYKHLFSLNPAEMEMLQDEFVDYQLLHRSEIPQYVWMDTVWVHLSNVKSPAGHMRFPSLSRLARLVLVLPHSNADEERVFSLIRKNRTPFRPNLALDGTLSSIIQVKLANPEPCFKFEPTKEVIKKPRGPHGSTTK
uniref:HAT C-terminal dimerisation domain-containing protein n=1 Tax=Latimeria chalumnae TaxID=7897 RepID=H3ARC8_LATCH